MSAAWPPAEGLTTKVVPHKDAVISTFASTTINAPASHVFAAVRDVEKYKEWNNFCPKVTIQSQPQDCTDPAILHNGTLFTFHVIMNSAKPDKLYGSALKVSDVSTPQEPSSYISASTLEKEGTWSADLTKVYRISWISAPGFMTRLMYIERFHEIIILDDNKCEVRTWENHAGPLAYVVKAMYQSTLMDKFQLWCDDLKKYCEGSS